VIKDAIGKVRSYLSHRANWEKSGKQKGKPGWPAATDHPTLYQGCLALEMEALDLQEAFVRINVDLFPSGNLTKGVGDLGLPPLEPRTLSTDQVRSLKSVCDRLERFHQLKGRRQMNKARTQAHRRPWRDRAIVYVMLSTGLRREELVNLDLDQVEPRTLEALRQARSARVTRVRDKGKTERTVFLCADARAALTDYLERERPWASQRLPRRSFSLLRVSRPGGRMGGCRLVHQSDSHPDRALARCGDPRLGAPHLGFPARQSDQGG
jgi:integrase